MGVVLQETFLFDDTIRANLGLKDEEIPLERLRGAAAAWPASTRSSTRCPRGTAPASATTATSSPAGSGSG